MVKIKKLKKGTTSVIYELLSDIRRADFKELCMGPVDPFTAVLMSIDNSRRCYVVRDTQKHLLAVFGLGNAIVDVNGTKATPIWFLGTNWAYRHNKALVYYGKQFCNRFIEEVGPLCNFIWAGNEPAIRYIQHLGATLMDVVPMGRNGEMFVPFILSEVK